MAVPLFAIMAGAGLAKNMLIDQPRFQRQQEVSALQNSLAPLFGKAPDLSSMANKPSGFQSAMDYGLIGAQMQSANPGMFGGSSGGAAKPQFRSNPVRNQIGQAKVQSGSGEISKYNVSGGRFGRSY